jgi:hypothetical protein
MSIQIWLPVRPVYSIVNDVNECIRPSAEGSGHDLAGKSESTVSAKEEYGK